MIHLEHLSTSVNEKTRGPCLLLGIVLRYLYRFQILIGFLNSLVNK